MEMQLGGVRMQGMQRQIGIGDIRHTRIRMTSVHGDGEFDFD